VSAPTKPPAELVKLLTDSLRWSRDHKGEKQRHMIPCEWCFQQGLCQAIIIGWQDGATVNDIREFYTSKINSEKKPSKKRVVVPSRRRVVVRRKK